MFTQYLSVLLYMYTTILLKESFLYSKSRANFPTKDNNHYIWGIFNNGYQNFMLYKCIIHMLFRHFDLLSLLL